MLFAGTVGLSNTNDITSLNAAGISFQSGAGAFNLSGNSIQISGPIVNSSTSTQTIGLAMQLTGSQAVTATSGNIVLAGVISDAGSGIRHHGQWGQDRHALGGQHLLPARPRFRRAPESFKRSGLAEQYADAGWRQPGL